MGIFGKFKKTDKKDKQVDEKKPVKVSIPESKEARKQESKQQQVKKPEDKKSEVKEVKDKPRGSRHPRGVLIKPLITEKATDLSQFNKYVFEVSSKANKLQIADAILEQYNVKPIAVNIISNAARSVRYGRTLGKTKSWKKAIVTLPDGKTIKVHEGV